MSQANRRNKRTPKKRTKKKMPERKGAFWQHKTAEEIAKEQGKGPITDLDKIIGGGKDLWDSDEEFERFVAGIYERRRQSRGH
jgi:hypothetical protein